VAKVVKGGRRFQFRVTIVAGDNHGKIGLGIGKANAVPDAMRKATEHAHKNMKQIALTETTIPHEVTGRTAGAVVLLKPASAGTGVIAGGGVRSVLEAAGVHDILTKSLGSAKRFECGQSHVRSTGIAEIARSGSRPAWKTSERPDSILGTEEEWLRKCRRKCCVSPW